MGSEEQLFYLCLPKGATVLFLNATDLDRSREYGQESIIYSLEGSSQFRINARSGEPLTCCSAPLGLPSLGQSRAMVSFHAVSSKLDLSARFHLWNSHSSAHCSLYPGLPHHRHVPHAVPLKGKEWLKLFIFQTADTRYLSGACTSPTVFHHGCSLGS